MTSITLRYTDK